MGCQHGRCLFYMLVGLLVIGFSGCSEDEELAVPPEPPEASEEASQAAVDPVPSEGAPGALEERGNVAQNGAVPAPEAPPAAPEAPAARLPAAPPAPPGPTPEQCLAALESMVDFTTKMGQERPGTAERKEFLGQCEGWPLESVTCLIGAQEPPAVVKCMKPIAELEMRRSRQAMRQKTVEEQSRLLGEEARKRADAVGSVIETAGEGRSAPKKGAAGP